MVKRPLGRTGYDISAVFYGGIVSMSDGQDLSDQYVSWAIDRGVNYFDVAPSYGDAEEKLGNSLMPYRKDVYLACKTEKRLLSDAEAELRNSLKNLHTDYFDVYQLHAIKTVEDVETAFGCNGVMELMIKAREADIIRKVGITAHNEEAALKALSLYDFDTVLFPLNWGLNLVNGMGSALCTDAKKRNMGLLGMKSLIQRAWLNEDERSSSMFPKSWCKPIDIDDVSFRLAAMRYSLSLGVNAIVPPGDFTNFSFAVQHIDECLNNPLCNADVELLKNRLPETQNHMFFEKRDSDESSFCHASTH